jgi:hypothetical protein
VHVLGGGTTPGNSRAAHALGWRTHLVYGYMADVGLCASRFQRCCHLQGSGQQLPWVLTLLPPTAFPRPGVSSRRCALGHAAGTKRRPLVQAQLVFAITVAVGKLQGRQMKMTTAGSAHRVRVCDCQPATSVHAMRVSMRLLKPDTTPCAQLT